MPKVSSYWIKSGKYSFMEQASILFFGVLSFYFLVRTLDKGQYGTWILYITVVNLLDTARHGFFKNPLIRFLNMEENKHDPTLHSSSFLLNLASSTLIAFVILGISYPISTLWKTPDLVTLFYIHLITNIGLTFFFHFEYLLKANLRFGGSSLGYIVRGAVFFLCILFFHLSDTSLSLAILGFCYAASIFAGAISSAFYVYDLFHFSFRFKGQWIRKLFGYGKFTLSTNISAVLLRYIDTWMIGFYLTPVAVAIYNVPVRIASLFEVPSMTLATIIYPQAVRRMNSEGKVVFKQMYEKSVAVILLLTIPFVIVVMVLAKPIVLLLAGGEYLESVNILRVTILYGLIVPFNKQMGVLLDAVGKAKTNSFFVMRNAVINLVLNAIAIPVFGIIGAAYATLSTFVIVLFINQWYMHRKFDVAVLPIFKYILDFGREAVAKGKSLLKK